MKGVRSWIVAIAAGVAGAAGVAYLVFRSESAPNGPVPVVWDRTPCAECRMSVSDRAYAAQLQTRDGQVLDFDDPGCLFRYERNEQPAIHAIYYRHLREDRWIPESQVAFIPSGPSPMGYDLGAVEAGTEGAISRAQAREQVLSPRGARPEVASDAH